MSLELIEEILREKYKIKTFKLTTSEYNVGMIKLANNSGYNLMNVIKEE